MWFDLMFLSSLFTPPVCIIIGTFRGLRFTVGWPLTDGNIPVRVHDFSGHPTVKRRLRKVPNVGHGGVCALTKIGHDILRLLREHRRTVYLEYQPSTWDRCKSYHLVLSVDISRHHTTPLLSLRQSILWALVSLLNLAQSASHLVVLALLYALCFLVVRRVISDLPMVG